MNEQLTVKNFGPIKDATVDFKKVTVFIGPTGGGKSTLAKLAAVFRNVEFYSAKAGTEFEFFENYSINNYFKEETQIIWNNKGDSILVKNNFVWLSESLKIKIDNVRQEPNEEIYKDFINQFVNFSSTPEWINVAEVEKNKIFQDMLHVFLTKKLFTPIYASGISPSKPSYIPSERAFVSALEYSWAGLMRDDIGLSKTVLDFANSFSNSRKDISELDIPMFNVTYKHINGRDFIEIPDKEEPLMLLETASGIQSVTPLLVLIENISRNTEQLQSFIIEEPELNLYPTAQRDLVYTLLEKCTQGENDLTITTHSPYVLTALNISLYAQKVAALFPHNIKKVEKVLPRKYWLKPEDFNAYYVGGGTVRRIFDDESGLLDENELDSVSFELADVFNALTRLRKPKAVRQK